MPKANVSEQLDPRAQRLRRMSPALLVAGFVAALVALRAFDLLVLRLDSWPDPTITSRVLSVLLVLAWLRASQRRVSAIGLHSRNAGSALMVGVLALGILFACLYAIEWMLLVRAGEAPRIYLGLVSPSGAVVAGAPVIAACLAGQVVNAFSEECIFRGVILPQLMRHRPFWKANLLQALLFALAHLVWPVSNWMLGNATASQAFAEVGMLLLFTGIGGLVFGYLYYRSDSLWVPMGAHLVDNAVWMLIHIGTATRVNAELDVGIVARVGFLSLTVLVWLVARRARIAPLRPFAA